MTYNPYWVQGRYILPLIPFLIGFSLQLVKSELQLPSHAQMKLLAGLLSLSHAIAFLTLVQRYSIGSERSLTNPFSFEWSYFPVLPALSVWLMGSLGFIALMYFGTNILVPFVNAEAPTTQSSSLSIDD
jgi:nitrate reductase NapE component